MRTYFFQFTSHYYLPTYQLKNILIIIQKNELNLGINSTNQMANHILIVYYRDILTIYMTCPI